MPVRDGYQILSKKNDKKLFQRTVQSLQLPSTTIENLRQAGFDSFAAARKYGLKKLEKISPLLAAHARLALISGDETLNRKLVEAGISGVMDLAYKKLPDLVKKTGVAADRLQAIQERAKTAAHILQGVLAGDIIAEGTHLAGGIHLDQNWLDHDWPDHFPQLEWKEPENTDWYMSALGPVAYLVDLLQFLQDFFQEKFPSIESIERRFCRPFKDLAICRDTVEQELPQAEITNEVLERYIILKNGAPDRDSIYESFSIPSLGCPHPALLVEITDSYLNVLGLSRQTATDALQAADGQDANRTELDFIISRKHIPESKLRELVKTNVTIALVDSLPDMVRTSLTGGIYPRGPVNPADLDWFKNRLDQAEKYIQLVKAGTLPKIRANLIHLALKAAPSVKTEKKLGDYLHTDLTYTPAVMTTRVASAIETLQSFVQAARLGSEPLNLTPERKTEFETRWKWFASYSIWHAAMTLFLYPENFLLQNTRRNKTPEFTAITGELEADANALPLMEAIDSYRNSLAWSQYASSACGYGDRVLLFGPRIWYDSADKLCRMQLYWSQIDAYGEWSGWRLLPFYPSELDHSGSLDRRFEGTFCFQENVFLVFSTREPVEVKEHVEGYGDFVTITKSKYSLQVYRWRPPVSLAPSGSSVDPKPLLEWSDDFIYPPTKKINGVLYATQTGIRTQPVFVTDTQKCSIYLQVDQQEALAYLKVYTRDANGHWTSTLVASGFSSFEGGPIAIPREVPIQAKLLAIGSINGKHYLGFTSGSPGPAGAFVLAIDSSDRFRVLSKYDLPNDGNKFLGGFTEKQSLALFFRKSPDSGQLLVKNLNSSNFS